MWDVDPDAQVLWTPWQRVEVFNGLYQAERAGAIAKGEAIRAIRLLEEEVRLGYWPHREFSWTDAVRLSARLARQPGPRFSIRGMDLFHVAVARSIRAQAFLSFDDDQNRLAEAAGLPLAKRSASERGTLD